MKPALLALPALAAALMAPAVAAARPTRGYIHADPAMVRVIDAPSYNTIYLNGCFADGDCDITFGFEDSRSNHSSIASGHLSPFAFGQVTWDALVECVRKNYEPFDVVVTDEDPGDQPHWEALVAGTPDEVGMEGFEGVSPWTCGLIDNAITYSFANVYQAADVAEMCWTVSQETAHAFGLEHEYLCEDPMSYRRDCPPRKFFHNRVASCGTYSARARCGCGRETQNSYAMLRDIFGPGNVEHPTVSLAAPAPGAKVVRGFAIDPTIESDVNLVRVELWINGRKLTTDEKEPFTLSAPSTLSDGAMHVEVRAYNAYEAQGSATVNVVQGEPCGGPDDCADIETCVDGRCVLGPGQDGGLGEACVGDASCWSGTCGKSSDGDFCAEPCEVGAGGCPDGFGCLAVDDRGVCWRGAEDSEPGGGGCQSGGPAGSLPLALGLLGLIAARRRRRG